MDICNEGGNIALITSLRVFHYTMAIASFYGFEFSSLHLQQQFRLNIIPIKCPIAVQFSQYYGQIVHNKFVVNDNVRRFVNGQFVFGDCLSAYCNFLLFHNFNPKGWHHLLCLKPFFCCCCCCRQIQSIRILDLNIWFVFSCVQTVSLQVQVSYGEMKWTHFSRFFFLKEVNCQP